MKPKSTSEILSKVSEAISSLKQVIYPDTNFIMEYNDAILSESDGLSIKHLREIILTTVQKHAIL